MTLHGVDELEVGGRGRGHEETEGERIMNSGSGCNWMEVNLMNYGATLGNYLSYYRKIF